MVSKQSLGNWLAGIASTLAVCAVLSCFSMWNDLQALKQWKADQWPLEKQLILMENEQTKARLALMEGRLDQQRETHLAGNQ